MFAPLVVQVIKVIGEMRIFGKRHASHMSVACLVVLMTVVLHTFYV
jgi:hypothetical protein